MRVPAVIAASVLAAATLSPVCHAEVAPPAPVAPAVQTDEAAVLVKENALLKEKLKTLESCSITSNDLAVRNCRRLKDIAADIRAQRQGLADFEVYVKWMSANVAGYSKYISASSVAAGFAKALPIPYAGQASVFTKFVANAALSLSSASVSINNYLVTSQQFLTRTDKLDPAKGVNAEEVTELVRFADKELLKGMMEVQEKLASTSELTSSSLSFLETMNHYLGSSDQYWAKTKNLLKTGDEKKDKGFIAESTAALRDKAHAFNGKFKAFDDTVKKDAPMIKALVAYDDLMREIDPKVAKLK